MVFLLQRLTTHSLKLFSKLENHNHHHHHHNALSSSLQTFQSNLSNFLNQPSFNSIPTSDFLSLIHIQQCFSLLRSTNQAFAKLVVEIDYPLNKWEVTSIDEYLNYSLVLLELLNSISSLISQLGQSRVSLSHALSLVEKSPLLGIEHLKPIQQKCLGNDFKEKNRGNLEEKVDFGKVWVFNQALMEMKRIGFWVCGITLSGLCSDIHPFVELRKSGGGFEDSLLGGVWKWKFEEGVFSKEVREVNDAVEFLVGSMGIEELKNGAKELERRLEILEKLLEGVERDSNGLFSEVLAVRNELLDSFRQKNKK